MAYGRPADGFYTEVNSTDAWVAVPFGFVSGRQILIGSVAVAEFSYSSEVVKPVHGELRVGQKIIFDQRFVDRLWIKSKVPATPATVRIYAW